MLRTSQKQLAFIMSRRPATWAPWTSCAVVDILRSKEKHTDEARTAAPRGAASDREKERRRPARGGVQGDPRLPISPDCLESGEFSLLLPGIEAEWYKGAVAVCPAWCDRTFRICL